jgi:hypothetical protein
MSSKRVDSLHQATASVAISNAARAAFEIIFMLSSS